MIITPVRFMTSISFLYTKHESSTGNQLTTVLEYNTFIKCFPGFVVQGCDCLEQTVSSANLQNFVHLVHHIYSDRNTALSLHPSTQHEV